MKQLHVKNYQKVMYGGPQNIGLLDGATEGVFDTAGIVIPIPIVVRNLSIYIPKPGHGSVTVNVQKNAVSGSLGVTCGAGVLTPVKNTVGSISYAAGDILRGRITGDGVTFDDAPSMGLCLETEGAENIYGQSCLNMGSGTIGGAFGNGHAATYGGSPTPSNSRSYSALAGTLTGLANHINFAPGAGVWTSYIVKNGVIQDGTGGTVDTAAVLTGSTQFTYKTFVLPIAIQDIVDILTLRTGSASGANVSNCVTFAPTTTGRFMFCGGSNAAINSGLDHRWIDSSQDALPEEEKAGIIGPGGVLVHGLYIHKFAPGPNPTQTTTNTLRRSSTDTGLSVTLVQLQTSGSDLTPAEIFPEDVSIDLKCTNANGGNGNSLFWAIPVSVLELNTLTVQKLTDPTGSPQSFDFLLGGSFTPIPFSLQDGGVADFSVAAGTYSVAETPVANWTTSMVVSNGNPPSAITVVSGETVAITVTNVDTTGGGGNGGGGDGDCPEQVSAGCWSPHDANRTTVELDGDYDL